ncbi:MAG: hypothetical protein HY287_07390 [Planctomycetes bacterium]|nr:hypothetical protein [Planctomycetota bacterium]MBI3834136.1 hypothetical protein [Planctomycetota bacterium]
MCWNRKKASPVDTFYVATWLALLSVAAGGAVPGSFQQVLLDPLGDAIPRPMDPGAGLPFDVKAHRLIDLRQLSVVSWSPYEPQSDLFLGEFDPQGQFVRLVLVLDGLVNPPGPSDPFDFDPFRYGANPAYGFIEIDMDDDVDTGGELDAPQYRYLGNVARFGGQVSRVALHDRVALDGSAFDGDFETPPFVERSGEEFHLALLGDQFIPADIRVVEGNGDLIFEAGETWILRGSFFHRAHGFEPFSFVEGGPYAGAYMPMCELQFHHDVTQDVTYVTLVFPLTNDGAGLMLGEPTQKDDEDPTNQASVMEALDDLQTSAIFLPLVGTGIPEEDIIRGWAQHIPAEHLDPSGWTITALLGSSYTAPSPNEIYFLWTDVYPNVILGDSNGSGVYDGQDRQMIASYIASHDALDGARDGRVTIDGFATDFNVLDLNYDGRVDGLDLAPELPNGDSDRDGDRDLADFAVFQRCFGEEIPGDCQAMDLIHDFSIDLLDFATFHVQFEGPDQPMNP